MDSGRDVKYKLSKLRDWIQQQPSSAPSYLKAQEPSRQYVQVATLVTSLACIGMFTKKLSLVLFSLSV